MTTLGEFYAAWNEAKAASVFAWRLGDLGHTVDYPGEGTAGRIEIPVHEVSALLLDWTRDTADGEAILNVAQLAATTHAELNGADYVYHEDAARTLVGAASPELPEDARGTLLAQIFQSPGPIKVGAVTYQAFTAALTADDAAATIVATFAPRLEGSP